jgi:hypothetical protein
LRPRRWIRPSGLNNWKPYLSWQGEGQFAYRARRSFPTLIHLYPRAYSLSGIVLWRWLLATSFCSLVHPARFQYLFSLNLCSLLASILLSSLLAHSLCSLNRVARWSSLFSRTSCSLFSFVLLHNLFALTTCSLISFARFTSLFSSFSASSLHHLSSYRYYFSLSLGGMCILW